MTLIDLVIVQSVAVVIIVPIWIFIMVKYYNLDAHRRRVRRSNPFVFWRDNTDNDAVE